ncbi:hypothetical protein M422DRAFT_32708 [Sphaerobolus stellatus SS14]|uniref:ACT domain-containing protein n=1 Tax=Sphaerobolus stellatus (strain SS14) TaxID=990650 RepID=A0A0C9VDI5_SPHS4|nr:hypothetical protein M422DRAFT_32708 [Sphaerobolus stellatus SS14]
MLRLPLRSFARNIPARSFCVSAVRSQDPKVPKPPPGVDDSTSALDYKSSQRTKPPPLPIFDLPRERSAEEAVNNILYNTPPPSLQPFKQHILNCLVQNEPGVLSRVAGILAGRGFNIDSLVVCQTEIKDLSRMCITLTGQDGVVEQARRQLEDLVPVWAVIDYTHTRLISRELLLVKVSILGPEYLEEQLAGGPSFSPRRPNQPAPAPVPATEEHHPTKLEQEFALAQSFEHSGEPLPKHEATISPSEALRRRYTHLQALSTLAKQFGGKIVDVSETSIIVELSGKSSRIEAFLKLVEPFGVLESARSGLMAMPRTPIGSTTSQIEEDIEEVDASLLPPG